MSLKNVCSIPRDWTLDEYSRHSCQDGSHRHLTRSQLKSFDDRGLVVWLKKAETNRDVNVVWILPEAHPGPQTSRFCSPDLLNSGLSFRVGEELARNVCLNKPWAKVMLADINMRREEAADLVVVP